MTYNVFSGTLNPTQSINRNVAVLFSCADICIQQFLVTMQGYKTNSVRLTY